MAGAGNYNVNNAAANTVGRSMAFNPNQNVQAYMNPYTDNVVNTSLNDLSRANDMALDRVSQNATQMGAWGGSRHGVAEAETNRGFMDQAARMSANLRSNAFTNAQNTNLAGAQFRLGAANQGFGMGQQINQNLMQQGMMQQALQQQLIDRARQQYQGYAGAPEASLSLPLAALGASPVPQSQETSKSPGLFNYLSLGLGLL